MFDSKDWTVFTEGYCCDQSMNTEDRALSKGMDVGTGPDKRMLAKEWTDFVVSF